MKIDVFDNGGITCDRYVVFIGNQIYYMSYYADRANEVNNHAGEFKSRREKIMRVMDALLFEHCNKIPSNLKPAIRRRCKELRQDIK